MITQKSIGQFCRSNGDCQSGECIHFKCAEEKARSSSLYSCIDSSQYWYIFSPFDSTESRWCVLCFWWWLPEWEVHIFQVWSTQDCGSYCQPHFSSYCKPLFSSHCQPHGGPYQGSCYCQPCSSQGKETKCYCCIVYHKWILMQKLICATPMIIQKANGESCLLSSECKSGYCAWSLSGMTCKDQVEL